MVFKYNVSEYYTNIFYACIDLGDEEVFREIISFSGQKIRITNYVRDMCINVSRKITQYR